MKQVAFRGVLTGLLLWGVYTETGVWTTIALGLIYMTIEVWRLFILQVLKSIKEVLDVNNLRG